MDPANKDNINVNSSINQAENLQGKIMQTFPDKFDLSIIGKIDLLEAEKIASEEVMFLNETDLIEGLEEFELVPIKNLKDDSDFKMTNKPVKSVLVLDEDEEILKTEPDHVSNINSETNPESIQLLENINELIIPIDDTPIILIPVVEDSIRNISEKNKNVENKENKIKSDLYEISERPFNENESLLIDEINNFESVESEIFSEKNEEFSKGNKLFTVTINEETLDAQLSSILNSENIHKTDLKVLDKYSYAIPDRKCRFVDDQFMSKPISDEAVSYNEDPLTERLVKMIEVADGKLELFEVTSKDGEFFNYILEDYTLYNSEKFDTVFKEEVFYVDSDFEFIENAIIRDDFTKYIHEIDDYFESEESLIQSEISEILGLIPIENDYIEDKLFGDYYKKYDLDNEIDFIKPEIDFFRSSYTGEKNLNYFTENENSILDAEKISIEEDISSANAIVFEEDISEIEEILKRDFNLDVSKIEEIEKIREIEEIGEIEAKSDEIFISEEITDITDNIIILEDKEKLLKIASEFPEKHENLIRLLSYLDGLFEKLPEEVIRKFAESEYFELYSKVLKEMGV